MKKKLVIGSIIALSLIAPLLAYALPMPVTDVLAEPVWAKQLLQAVYEGENLHQAVTIAVQNVVPTQYRWALNTHDPLNNESILAKAMTTITTYESKIQQNTGSLPPPDPALSLAQAGMNQLPGDDSDISSAQSASDAAQGELSATQAGHRFSALAITNAVKTRQFLYAEYLKKSSDDMAATAWMTAPNQVSGKY